MVVDAGGAAALAGSGVGAVASDIAVMAADSDVGVVATVSGPPHAASTHTTAMTTLTTLTRPPSADA